VKERTLEIVHGSDVGQVLPTAGWTRPRGWGRRRNSIASRKGRGRTTAPSIRFGTKSSSSSGGGLRYADAPTAEAH